MPKRAIYDYLIARSIVAESCEVAGKNVAIPGGEIGEYKNLSVTEKLNITAPGTGLVVSNHATLGGTLDVSGKVTLSAAGAGLDVSNNVTVGGTLGVAGKLTASAAVGTAFEVAGLASIKGKLEQTSLDGFLIGEGLNVSDAQVKCNKGNIVINSQNGKSVDLKVNNASVLEIRGNQMLASQNLSMGNKKITGVAVPTENDNVANKQYVDSHINETRVAVEAQINALTIKPPVVSVEIVNFVLREGAAPKEYDLIPGITIGGFFIDSKAANQLEPGTKNRYLFAGQTNPQENGIYILNTTNVRRCILERAPDYNTTADIRDGDIVFVMRGTSHADTVWVHTANEPNTPDTLWHPTMDISNPAIYCTIRFRKLSDPAVIASLERPTGPPTSVAQTRANNYHGLDLAKYFTVRDGGLRWSYSDFKISLGNINTSATSSITRVVSVKPPNAGVSDGQNPATFILTLADAALDYLTQAVAAGFVHLEIPGILPALSVCNLSLPPAKNIFKLLTSATEDTWRTHLKDFVDIQRPTLAVKLKNSSSGKIKLALPPSFSVYTNDGVQDNLDIEINTTKEFRIQFLTCDGTTPSNGTVTAVLLAC